MPDARENSFESETHISQAQQMKAKWFISARLFLKHRLRLPADSFLCIDNDVSPDSFEQRTIQPEHSSRCNLMRDSDCNVVIFSCCVSASLTEKKKIVKKFVRM